MEDTKILREIFVFRGLSPLDLTQFNKILKARKVQKGEVIIAEGEEGDAMYIIKSGSFEVRKGKGSREKVISLLHPGDHFGEMALIDRLPRSASVVAVSEGELIVLSKDQFLKVLEGSLSLKIRIYENFLESLCERLRTANELLLLSPSGRSSA
jgi:CRP-like cAMP-binding protein